MTQVAPIPMPTLPQRAWGFVVRALRVELRIYTSIARAVTGRRAIAPGSTGFGYHRPIFTILLIFIVLSAIEIPILDLIVHQWPPVRIGFLVLGIWGLTWMIGLLCAQLMRPHTVGPDGISVREGLEIDIALPWDDIAAVVRSPRVDEPKTPRVTESEGIRTLSIRVQNETNVEIELERRTAVRLPGQPPRGGVHEVDAVRLWVDDLDGFLDAVRRSIP